MLDHLRFTDISELVTNLIGFVLSEGFISWMEYFMMIMLSTPFELFPAICALVEKLDIWLKGEDGLELEPLVTKWIDTGRKINAKVEKKSAAVRQRIVSGVSLQFVQKALLKVPDWDILDDVSTKPARIQIDNEDSEDDAEIYLPLGSSEYEWSSDEDSEASKEAREPQAFTITKMDASKVVTPKALRDEPSTAQLLPLPLLSRLQGSPMIAVEEQIKILFQIWLALESMEELERRAMFQSLVEQAAIFAPATLGMFGAMIEDIDLDQAFELYSIAYSSAEKHDRLAIRAPIGSNRIEFFISLIRANIR